MGKNIKGRGRGNLKRLNYIHPWIIEKGPECHIVNMVILKQGTFKVIIGSSREMTIIVECLECHCVYVGAWKKYSMFTVNMGSSREMTIVVECLEYSDNLKRSSMFIVERL